jgi:peptidoglycan/xylan/chitin deacetylase (PgdA/CDA1 family)
MPRTLGRAGLVVASAALLLGWPVQAGLARNAVDVPILEYHRVGPEPVGSVLTDALTVGIADFRAQMEWLHAAGFHAVTPTELFDALVFGTRLPSRPIMLTFDDGYRDVLWNAAPLLRRLRLHATAFIITARVDGPDPSFLTWPELRRLERLGFDVGSHTVDHPDLTTLAPGKLAYELDESRTVLQQRLGRAVRWLSYPIGAFDPEVVAAALRAGYLLAFTEQPGIRQTDPLELHRYEILDSTGVGGLKALLASSIR